MQAQREVDRRACGFCIGKMTNFDNKAARKFCELCDWTYEVWVTHKCLFDDNPAPETNIGLSPWFAHRLSVITQEYALLQIAKLHDRGEQRGSKNLTIDYVVKCGDWGAREPVVREMADRLEALSAKIRSARNRILSHNDLDTVMKNATLGDFTEGEDDKYFAVLQELVNTVHDSWVGGPFPFNDIAKADAFEFLSRLERGASRRKRTF